MLVFAFLCMNYVYVTIDDEGNVVYPPGKEVKKDKEKKDVVEKNGEVNPSYQDDGM